MGAASSSISSAGVCCCRWVDVAVMTVVFVLPDAFALAHGIEECIAVLTKSVCERFYRTLPHSGAGSAHCELSYILMILYYYIDIIMMIL